MPRFMQEVKGELLFPAVNIKLFLFAGHFAPSGCFAPESFQAAKSNYNAYIAL